MNLIGLSLELKFPCHDKRHTNRRLPHKTGVKPQSGKLASSFASLCGNRKGSTDRMELKSPDKNIRIVGLAGIVAGLGMIVAGHASFGTTLLGGGLLFLALPLFRTAGKK